MKGVSVSVLAVWTLAVSTLVAATWPSPLVTAPSRAGVVPQAHTALTLTTLTPTTTSAPQPADGARPITPPRRPPAILVTEEGTPPAPLSVERANYEVTVTGFVARTRATLTFRNDRPRVLEGELVFPLPDGALLSGFALDVNGRLVDGVIVEAQQARIAFETEVRKGIDPGLVEWVRGNNFRTRVWPIPANGRRTIRVEYLSTLIDRPSADATDALYELPLHFGVPLEEFTLRVEVVRTDIVPEIRAGLGNVSFDKWQDRFVAETTRRNVTPDDLLVALPRVPRDHVAVDVDGIDAYFAIDDLPQVPLPPTDATTPRRIGVAWDASLSRTEADREHDLRVLSAHLARLGNVEVVAFAFRNVPDAPRRFDVRNGEAGALLRFLREQPCDGATNLSAVTFPADVAYTLLFSDGLWTIGGMPALAQARPVFAISGAAMADRGVLSAVSAASGGAFVDLARATDAEASERIGRPVFTLLDVTADGATDLEPRAAVPVTGRMTIAGRLTAPEARVRVRYGYGNGRGEITRTFDVRRSAAPATSTGIVARRWAERRVTALSIAPDANRDALVALGQRFSIVTPGTSLLVLERLEQYVEHKVTPPTGLPEMRAAYVARMADLDREKTTARTKTLGDVQEMWKRRVEWWARTFTYQPGFRYAEPKGSGAIERDARGQRTSASDRNERGAVGGAVPPPPRPAMAAPAAPAEMANEVSKTTGRADAPTPTAASIAIAAWNPDTPYLRALDAASSSDAYAVYLVQRASFGTGPAFYLDCADFFARRGDRVLALRILTNVAELKLEEARLLRVLAHRLEQVDELDLAVEVFERVRRMRPEEPQSHRDLALALDRRATMRQGRAARIPADALADAQRALSLLADVVMGTWDQRFPEVQVLALEEANRIATAIERGGEHGAWPLDASLRQLLDVDVRVVLTWDTDLTDMDLWVTEPSGEKCMYNHALTVIGGAISRDFTGGLGPEVYAVKRAMGGDYRIQANFFGTRSQSLTGPTTLQAVVYTNYGRANEERRAITLRLADAKEVVDIGAVTFGSRATP